MIKEIKHIFRNSYFFRQLFSVLLAVITYIFLFHSDYYQFNLLTSYRNIWFGFYSNISIIIFISIYLSSTIAFPLISLEKYSIFQLKMLPSKALSKLIWNKIILTFSIVSLISTVLYWDYIIFVRNILDFELSFHLFGYFYIIFTNFFLVVLNISFGMFFFDHKAENLVTYKILFSFMISVVLATFVIAYYGTGFKAFYLYIVTDFKDEQIYPNYLLLKILLTNFVFVFVSTVYLLKKGFRKFERYEI